MNRQEQKQIEKKVIVITGASSGVGRAMALELATKKAHLVLAARRSGALEELAKECEALGARVAVVPTDVRQADSVKELAHAAWRFGGAIDVWINNAGVLAAGEFSEIPEEVNENVIRTNLLGYMHGAHAAVPFFRQQGAGMLINNISIGGWFPTPYAAAYTASKFGLRGFSEALKAELNAYRNIHICDLYPAFLDTPGIQHAANYTGKVVKPAPPIYDPRKVARAVAALIVSPASRKMIGGSVPLLRVAYQLFPAITRNTTARVIRTYLEQADPIEHTDGNVLKTVEYGTGIDGGWRNIPVKPVLRSAAWMIAGLALGILALRERR